MLFNSRRDMWQAILQFHVVFTWLCDHNMLMAVISSRCNRTGATGSVKNIDFMRILWICPILGVSEHVGTSENLQIISVMIKYDELPSPVFSKPIPKPHLHKECGIIPGSKSNRCSCLLLSLSAMAIAGCNGLATWSVPLLSCVVGS